MKKITILCVGKLKERYWREAAEEYARRLSVFCELKIVEEAEERIPETASAAERDKALEKEGARLLKRISPDAYVIALAIDGKKTGSEGFAKKLETVHLTHDEAVFLIGSSYGLSKAVREAAQENLSFSDLTFPHQMARIILLEQLYRGYRIRNGAPYHK